MVTIDHFCIVFFYFHVFTHNFDQVIFDNLIILPHPLTLANHFIIIFICYTRVLLQTYCI